MRPANGPTHPAAGPTVPSPQRPAAVPSGAPTPAGPDGRLRVWACGLGRWDSPPARRGGGTRTRGPSAGTCAILARSPAAARPQALRSRAEAAGVGAPGRVPGRAPHSCPACRPTVDGNNNGVFSRDVRGAADVGAGAGESVSGGEGPSRGPAARERRPADAQTPGVHCLECHIHGGPWGLDSALGA